MILDERPDRDDEWKVSKRMLLGGIFCFIQICLGNLTSTLPAVPTAQRPLFRLRHMSNLMIIHYVHGYLFLKYIS